MLHHKFARTAEYLVFYSERRAYGQSSVPSGRLHINSLEGRVIENFPIGQAIERHTSRETKRLLAGFLRERSPMRGQHLFERSLHARRKIMMALFERLLRFSCRPTPLLEIRREQPPDNRTL